MKRVWASSLLLAVTVSALGVALVDRERRDRLREAELKVATEQVRQKELLIHKMWLNDYKNVKFRNANGHFPRYSDGGRRNESYGR